MNRAFVRDLVIVPVVIAAIATLVLGWLGGTPAAAPLPRPPPVPHSRIKDPVMLGAALYQRKGCVTCHTIDGTPRVGPSFLHDAGTVATLSDGTSVTVDADYIRRSVRFPQAQARPGYPASMPTFDDSLLSDRELDAIVAYLGSLR